MLMKMLRCVIGWREKMIEREREEKMKERKRNGRKNRRKREREKGESHKFCIVEKEKEIGKEINNH